VDSRLAGSVILVTGASGGIGGVTARVLAAEGARVVVHAHRRRAAADALAAEIGAGAIALAADLRREGDVERLFAEAIARCGRIDAVIANAGIWVERPAPVVDMTLAQWRQTIDADLTSAFLTCRAFLRHLRDAPREAAAIVLVASTAALFGEADHADYASAKAAMAYGLTKSLKNEIVRVAPRGRVNCVCPGWTLTPLTEPHVADAALLERVFATMPMRKIAAAEDVARAITFLASDRLAGHVSGTILPIAGGMEGRLIPLPGRGQGEAP
jgi:3-oxoacyl-[acyl-carrier protein] reductase